MMEHEAAESWCNSYKQDTFTSAKDSRTKTTNLKLNNMDNTVPFISA